MKQHRLIDCIAEKLSAGIAILLVVSQIAAFGEIIPANRRITWQGNTGIPGGVPIRTTIFANVKNAPYNALGDGSHDDTSAIQSAINACPANQVVYIPTGNYRVTGMFTINSPITVRGDGPGKTIINANGSGRAVFAFNAATNDYSYGTPPTPIHNITGGLTAGSTSITLDNASGVTVGGYLMIDQLNDSSFVSIVGNEGSCTWASRASGARAMGQTVEVTSVNGTTIGISPGLYTNYTASLTPQAVVVTPVLKNAGVEDLTVRCNNTGYTANFNMTACAYCWIKNVEDDYADGDHVDCFTSYRCEIRDSYFHDAYSHSPGQTDACVFLAKKTSCCLVENNILWRLHVSVMLNWGASGNVIGYNYSSQTFDSGSPNVLMQDLSCHGAHPMFNLWEGNFALSLHPDSTWGSSSHGTAFRNFIAGTSTANPPLTGRGPVVTGSSWQQYQANRAINLDFASVYYNIVGNVLGNSYFKTNNGVYMCIAPATRSYDTYRYIFSLGYTGAGDGGGDALESTKPATTMINHGNWDIVTGTQKWDSTIADHTLPNSLYLSAKPAWFGNLAWPPIDPANPSTAVPTSIPAGYRFVNGTNPPSTGGTPTPAPTPTPTPQPPKNLKVTP
ncbi:MAG: glycosyl hydrolase family 28-related protein [Verrucomicrobiota bacterium]